MGLFSKKTKTTSNQVATTQIDPFVKNYGQQTLGMFDALTSGVLGRYQNQAQGGVVNPQSPDQTVGPSQPTGPGSFVAPFSADTNAFFTGARNFTGSGQQLRDIAGGVTGGNIAQIADPGQIGQIGEIGQIGQIGDTQIDPVTMAEARKASEFMGDYINPYTGQVVDAALADYDVGADRGQNAMRARRGAGSAFGDRAAIADAIYGGELARGRGSLSAGLRADAFNTAAGLGAGDAGRFTSTSLANAGAANARSAAQAQLNRQRQIANSGIEGQNIGNQLSLAGMNANIQGQNIGNRLNLAGMNADIAGQNITNANAAAALRGSLLGSADAAEAARLGILGDAGRMQDDRAQRIAQEPLDLIKLRQALLAGTPYDQTVTSSGTSTGTSGGLGSILGGGLANLIGGLGSGLADKWLGK